MPRDEDDGTAPTIAPENAAGYDHTIDAVPGAPGVASRPRVLNAPAVSPFPKTITEPPRIVATAETIGADPASLAGARETHKGIPPAAGTSGVRTPNRSTVGNEMRAANIERFTQVTRDRFEVLDELARGGLGRVFRARDPRTGRIVAIKEVLHPQPEIIVRFAREALVTANLQHPSIVPVYEVGRWPGGEPFLAMKLVEGRTVDVLIREARTLNDRLALIPHLIAVADALAYAHSEHVIHRDLKPANVLVGAYGETVVIDWGLAKNLANADEPEEPLSFATTLPPENNGTVAGSVLGTPAYMPPEQARGEPLDERADVYAIGAILYHLLGGQRPFVQATSLDELLELVSSADPTPIAELVPDVPRELVTIAHKAMARDAVDRYPTAQGLADDLRKFTAGKLVGAHQYTSWELTKRWIAKHKATVAIATIAMGVLIVVGTVSAVRITQERDEANLQRRAAVTAKGEEETARSLAERRYRDSLLELARQEAIAANPARALTLAAGAVSVGGDHPAALDVTLTQALGDFAGLQLVIPPRGLATNAGTFAPDARRVYFATNADVVSAWDTVERKIAWEKPLAYIVRISPDGTRLAGANKAGEIILASATDGTQQAAWKHQAADGSFPKWLAWAADGAHFAASGDGGVWFGKAGDTALRHPEQLDKVWAIEFSPNSKYLAACTETGVIQILDVDAGNSVAAFTDLEGGCWSIAWRDNERVMGADKQSVRMWNVITRRVEQRFAQPFAYQIVRGGPATSPWLMTCGDGAIARIWNLTTGALLHELPGHELGCNTAVEYDRWVVTSDEKGNVYVWDPLTGERIAALPREQTILDLQVVRGRLAVLTAERALLWKLDADAVLRRIPAHSARIRDIAFEDSSAVWTASNDGTVRRSPMSAGEPLVLGTSSYSEPAFTAPDSATARKPANPQSARSVMLTADRKTVLTTYEGGAIRLWDARTGVHHVTWNGHTARVRRVVFTADGATAFSIGDTTVRKWDAKTGAVLAQQDVGGPGFDVALFDSDRAVATLADDNTVRIWNASDLARTTVRPLSTAIASLPVIRDRIVLSDPAQLMFTNRSGDLLATTIMEHVTFASVLDRGDHQWVAGAGISGIVTIADGLTGAPVQSFTHPNTQPVGGVAFSPDGTLIATLNDLRAWIWDAKTGALLATSPRVSGFLFKLAWSADGTQLAFGGGSGTVWVWRVRGRYAPTDLSEYTSCVSPWRLRDATLERTAFDPDACNVLPPFNP